MLSVNVDCSNATYQNFKYVGINSNLRKNIFFVNYFLIKNKTIILYISGISLFTPPEELPELPAPDEQRLREAAAVLQQRLVLRHWLARHGLQGYLARLLAVGVAGLEDVYWLEDNKAKQVICQDITMT